MEKIRTLDKRKNSPPDIYFYSFIVISLVIISIVGYIAIISEVNTPLFWISIGIALIFLIPLINYLRKWK